MITVLSQNEDYIVCIKPAGISSELNGMVSLLSAQENCQVYPVHRLDQAVGGVMVYAKSPNAATWLSSHLLEKEYLAVTKAGELPLEGELRDYLYHDKRTNKSFAVKSERKNAREAILTYRILETKDDLSLIRIRLQTGRTHQIRVQFASRKMPLFGDGKYGSRHKGNIALWSYHLKFSDPSNGAMKEFKVLPDLSLEPFVRFSSLCFLKKEDYNRILD
ncbi:MAG: RNA pseudouridine synthase [Erysipelotrichaceae bacterium]|nr:RNA pseudouridine synthase [Erysipelotrichaceae bacterium]